MFFSKKLQKKLEELTSKIDQIGTSLKGLSEKLDKLEERSRPRPEKRRQKPDNVVYDLHGNAVPSGGAMNLKSGTSSTRNPRKCKVWGCDGRTYKDGYCEKHFGVFNKENQ